MIFRNNLNQIRKIKIELKQSKKRIKLITIIKKIISKESEKNLTK